jgi:hypothetical protein
LHGSGLQLERQRVQRGGRESGGAGAEKAGKFSAAELSVAAFLGAALLLLAHAYYAYRSGEPRTKAQLRPAVEVVGPVAALEPPESQTASASLSAVYEIVYRGCGASESMQGAAVESIVSHVLKEAEAKGPLDPRKGYRFVCMELGKLLGVDSTHLPFSRGNRSCACRAAWIKRARERLEILVEKSGDSLEIVPQLWEEIVSEYSARNGSSLRDMF